MWIHDTRKDSTEIGARRWKGTHSKKCGHPAERVRERLANESRARSRILGHWPFDSLGRPTCVFVLRQNFMCQAHTGKGRRESEKYNALSNSTRLRDHTLAGLDQSRWRNNLAFRYAIRHRLTTAIIGRHRHHHHHRRCPCRRCCRCPRLLANRLHTCKASWYANLSQFISQNYQFITIAYTQSRYKCTRNSLLFIVCIFSRGLLPRAIR